MRVVKPLVYLAFLVLFVNLSVVAYVRVTQANASRRGCERNKLDRQANARGWRIAEGARRHDGEIKVANKYATIAHGLEQRSKIDCKKTFPILPGGL